MYPQTKEELEDMIDIYDRDWFNKVFMHIAIVIFVLITSYFIYVAVLLNNYILTLIIAGIIFHLATHFQLKIDIINAFETNIDKKYIILQYIFSILEIYIASNVIFKIFQ